MKISKNVILLFAFMFSGLVSAQDIPDVNKLVEKKFDSGEYTKSVLDKQLYRQVEQRVETNKTKFAEAAYALFSKKENASLLKNSTASLATAANEDDSLSLVDLYNNTGGPNWTDNTNWLTDSVYKWKGVVLNENGRVTGIDLTGNNLTGQLPASISKLTALNYLYLHENNLTGDVPAEIGLLTNLEALYLTGNGFAGAIPKELGDITGLIWLGLGSNDLSGELPVELFQLANLKFLDVSKNQLTGSIPSEIVNLAEIEALFFENNNFSGSIPKELGSLTNLKQLALYRNNLSGTVPAELGNLSNLTQLYLHANSLTGDLPAELQNLSNLEYLYLSSNKLTGAFPAWVCNLTGLKELFLADNLFTGEIPADINKLKDLQLLGLNNNSFSGTIPKELSELTNLIGLYLSDNNLEGTIPAELGMLANLNELWLSSNNLSGDVPQELNSLTNVYRLLLSYNNFTSLPDLSAVALDSAFFIQNNSLDFGDLETANVDWSSIADYSYCPQADVPLSMVETGDDVVFSVNVPGANNEYHWFREGIIIKNETGNTLTVGKVYAGEYCCAVTNDDFPDLILISEKKIIHVYSVEFSVTDGYAPVANAEVTLDGYGYEYTDANGIALFYNVAPEDDIAYTVNASGFADASGFVSVVDADVHEDVTLSVPTGVEDGEGVGLEIYPNPVFEKLFLKSSREVRSVEICSLTGELIMTKSMSNTEGTIDLTGIKNGMYLIVIRTDNNVYTRKIVKR